MNHSHNNIPLTASALALAPPPPQPHRPCTSCDRHPEERFTGFCPSCLFERLSVLDIPSSSSSTKPPSSSSVSTLKSIFKPSSGSSSSLFPELRRTKSFSATKNNNDCLSAFEPQRRSCDVRVRNTLWSLFNEEEIVKSPVFEEEIEIESEKDINCVIPEDPRSSIDEIVEEIEERDDFEETNKEQMETTKKPNRSFWSAASVLSKKLQKWRQKQKLKKHHRRGGGIGDGSTALPVEKSIGRQLRDTQSEIAEYRRSCDTDPRFSIDAGRFSLDAGRVSFDAARVSVDDPRYSFDEPRASWDGYLLGRTRMPSMLSVVEDSPVRNQSLRSDGHILVEEPPLTPPPQPVNDEIVPGGSEQTREYYTDSSSRRRKSLDRSSSTRKISASVIAEIDELNRSASKTRVSPSQAVLHSHSHSHSNSLRDDCSDIGVRGEDAGTVESSKKGGKKSKRWSWNIFGLLHRKNGNNKFEEEEEKSGVDRTFSGSWNVDTRKGFDPKMMRSNSSVSWRSSGAGAGGGFRRNSVDGYVSEKKKVSSSSTNGRKIENGMLKYYLTPSKGRRREGSNSRGQTTTRPVPGSHPLGRNVMNFY